MAILQPTLPGIMRPAVLGTVEASFTDECVVMREVTTEDEYGQNEVVLVEIATVPCRVLPDNQRAKGDTTIGGRETGRAYFRIIVPVGTDVADGDTAHVNSVAYEIQRITNGYTDALFTDLEVVRIED